MKNVLVHRADRLRDEVTSIVITIDRKLPKLVAGVSRAPLFKEDAAAIVNALASSLPGGTYDHVLVEMMQRKASQLIVAYEPGEFEFVEVEVEHA